MGHQTALFLTRCAVAWSQLRGVATVGFLTFHPKLRALTQCWAARTSHQSRACCSVHMSHLRPGHPFSGQRPQRAQKARPGTSHFFPQPHPGLHAHGSRDSTACGEARLHHLGPSGTGRAAGRAGPRAGAGPPGVLLWEGSSHRQELPADSCLTPQRETCRAPSESHSPSHGSPPS